MSRGATCRLIVTADDYGYSLGRNRGIIEAYKNGVVRRTSLMVNGVQAEDAVRLAKQCHIPMGLHFNISEGRPILPTSQVSTLVGENGFFLDKQTLEKAVDNGKVDTKQVRNELKAQIAKYRTMVGEDPTYIDGHQHLHIVPGLADTFACCLKEEGILETRIPVQQGIENHTWVEDWLLKFNIQTVDQAKNAANIFKNHGIGFTDYFFGLTTMGESMTLQRLDDALQLVLKAHRESNNKNQNFTCELMSHPGFPTELTLETYSNRHTIAGCGEGPDDFEQSQGRKHELDILTSAQLKKLLSDVTLVNRCVV